MSSPVRSYLGASAADRVAGRRRRLMDVAFELMASDGWSNVTIELLCRTAKLNKRYFYESFADLEQLVAAVVDELAGRGILVRSPSQRGVAEEAPGAYKDVDAVVEVAEQVGLARRVARLVPLLCIKG